MQETLATHEHILRLYVNEQQILKRAGSQHGSVAGENLPVQQWL